MATYDDDPRVVLTLDAGGTTFRFSAMRGNRPVTDAIVMPSNGDDLKRCLAGIVDGFTRVKAQCPLPPVAISFAFPAPADYPNGIIGDLNNLSGFRGGVALGPMLEDVFGIPVTINNDADLFTYGEAIAGFLPYVNGLLTKSGSAKRYRNLLGITLGTGFGGGIAHNGNLLTGDNSMAGEIWALRNKRYPTMYAEESVSIRGVRRVYAQEAGIVFDDAPDPRIIEQIALGEAQGNRAAAIEAYRSLGEMAGDSLGNALNLIDGLAVIGGGLSKGHRLFMPALVDELNSSYIDHVGRRTRRLTPVAFNLEDPEQLDRFLKGENQTITVPGSHRRVNYDSLQRIGVGLSRVGTSEAVALGAYAFALQELDAN